MTDITQEAILDRDKITAYLASEKSLTVAIKSLFSKANKYFDQDFHDQKPIIEILGKRTKLVDHILHFIWYHHLAEHTDACLIAVGGYGREHLFPHSDIDLLILTTESLPAAIQTSIQGFVAALWDTGLNIGHSVRDITTCTELAQKDHVIYTTLIDARYLTGNKQLFDALKKSTKGLWSKKGFYRAKLKELYLRHKKYDDSAYNLEPNVKNGPGAIRDIQTLIWIAKNHFNITSVNKILSKEELQSLTEGRDFLFRIRYTLHNIAQRPEERLLFDHQKALANYFNYADTDSSLAIEKFMKEYYRRIHSLRTLLEVFIQLFREDVYSREQKRKSEILDEYFQLRGIASEINEENVFLQHPPALMKIFLHLARNSRIKLISSNTLRLIRKQNHLVDDAFRNCLEVNHTFLTILRLNRNLETIFRQMRRFGILGRYIPEFGRISGQMQYDLVHVYTVDQHTVNLLCRLARFNSKNDDKQSALVRQCMHELEKPELIYIAALFHDIAKGRGGDHSQLGAIDVTHFCQRHNLSAEDTKLVTWLVAQHLTMSMTAQRKDTTDPDVINTFTQEVKTEQRLNYLYTLTVADIQATNPTLWNNWKATLLSRLYFATQHALSRLSDEPISRRELINNVKRKAEKILIKNTQFTLTDFANLWNTFDADYFLIDNAETITRHTKLILQHQEENRPIVDIHQDGNACTEIFIYQKNKDYLFATTTALIDREQLNILEARMMTTSQDFRLSSYIVSNLDDSAIRDKKKLRNLQIMLEEKLTVLTEPPKRKRRRTPRRLRHFTFPSQFILRPTTTNGYSIIQLNTPNRPGLLAIIGKIFFDNHIRLHGAKIATIGERVEDTFFVSDSENLPITDQKQFKQLQLIVCNALDKAV